jgi:uncharacterized membrane protein YjdF
MNIKISERKEVGIISLIFFSYSILFLLLSFTGNNHEYIYYNFALMGGFVVLLLFYKKIHLKIPMLIGLIILGFLHLAGGNFSINGFKLYQTSLSVIPYDKIVHTFGSFIITVISYNFIHETLSKADKKKAYLIGFIIIMTGLGIGAIVEIFEFLATIIFENTIVGNYANNATDLIANAAGAIIAAAFALAHFKKQKK